jgi:hypothetical protein
MMEDNISRQADEVEALSAIYGEDWKVESAGSRIYSMRINIAGDNNQITLQMTLPPEYPSESPPLYMLSAPSLKRDDKIELTNNLDEIYFEHYGENILFMWIEKIREFAQNKEKLENSLQEASDESLQDDLEEEIRTECHSPKGEMLDQCPPIHSGEPILDRRSTFQAHVAPVVTVDQVNQVVARLLENKKIASATHNMYAYRIFNAAKGQYIQDCDDDGETHAGSRLLHLMQILEVKDVIVVVSRWYGGIQLGPDRFKHINNCARELLSHAGYIHSKQDEGKKGSSHSKKKKGK